MANKIMLKANGKVNLYLDITGTRSDGYHNIISVMQSISLGDRVEVEIFGGDGISLTSTDDSIPVDKSNLAYKSAELFLNKIQKSVKIHIHLDKKIPTQAGLGGGSADAAAVLVGLNQLFNSPLTKGELQQIGLSLGADVPFCIVGGTKICSGIGEIIDDLPPLPNCKIIVVKPDTSFSTGLAYGKYDSNPLPQYKSLKTVVKDFSQGDIGHISNNLYNIFETLHGDEKIFSIKEKFLSIGALGSLMTGSGSAVLGIFSEDFSGGSDFKIPPEFFKEVAFPVNQGVEIITNL